MRRRCMVVPIAVLLVLFARVAAHAQMEVTLQQDTWTGTPGQSYTFWGTLRNAGTYPIWIGGVTIWPIPSEIHMALGDYWEEYANWVAEPGDSFTGPLFDVSIVAPIQIPWVTHFAVSWRPVDGPPPDSQTIADFTINAVPEPSSVLALSCGFVGLLLLKRPRLGRDDR